MSHKGYSENDVIEAVKTSSTIRQVIKKLGLIPAGGNYATIHQIIKKLNLNTSHFTGQASNKGKQFALKRPIEDYLNNVQIIQSYKLKKRLIREGYLQEKCYSCNRTEWLGNKIPLELEHKNGIHLDNTLSNLTLLCPNCHALTSTYRGKNKK